MGPTCFPVNVNCGNCGDCPACCETCPSCAYKGYSLSELEVLMFEWEVETVSSHFFTTLKISGQKCCWSFDSCFMGSTQPCWRYWTCSFQVHQKFCRLHWQRIRSCWNYCQSPNKLWVTCNWKSWFIHFFWFLYLKNYNLFK